MYLARKNENGKKWGKATFTCSYATAEHIIKMAKEDDNIHHIEFIDERIQSMLEIEQQKDIDSLLEDGYSYSRDMGF